MSDLILLRHAKAISKDGNFRDIDRPLDERGRDSARAVAQWLTRNRVQPALVLCSPAVRTRETLSLVGAAFDPPPPIEFESGLYVADADRLLARLREVPEETHSVMIVGHNPGLHELALALADTSGGPLASRLAINLPTAGLARFEVAVEWAGLLRRVARLVALFSPKDSSD
jgi:phosphohistidine phosphatase